MNGSYSFIFLVQGGKIAVYRQIGNKFFCTEFRGEKDVPFNPDFWKIWLKTFSFAPESSCIDFAFVSTDPQLKDFHLPDNFKKAEHSGWTTSTVNAFMQTLFPGRPFNLWEDDSQLLSAPEKTADNYYLTRFNFEKETKGRGEEPSSQSPIYFHIVNDPLPPEILEELGKKQ